MEELQDALEDAQYVNAINVDEGPRPIIAWEHPSDEVIDKWKHSLVQVWENDPNKPNKLKPFDFEWTISSALGLFLFSSHVKDICGDHVRMCFIEEVLRWRCLRGRSRGMKLRKIYERYLLSSKTKIDEETKEVTTILPEKTLIDEIDMAYKNDSPRLDDATLNDLIEKNVDESCSKCCIGIDGPLRDEILEVIENCLSSIALEGNSGDSHTFETNPSVIGRKLSHMPDFSSAPELSETIGMDGNCNGNVDTFPESAFIDQENAEITRRTSPFSGSRSFALSKLPDDLLDKVEQVILACLRKKYWSEFAKKGVKHWDKLLKYLWHESRPVVEEDFYLMRVLGRGGFGLVSACKKGTTGKLYAMKVMNKRRIKAKKSSILALNELAVLKVVDSPFVVNLKYSFQTKDDLFLILDLMTGGDLSFHLSQMRRFSSEQCLYYAARIMLGLQAIHDKNYVYRDLKPENLLLSEDGRVRITDLGLATEVTPKLHGAAGTRGYWAPEMLKRNDKGKRLNYDQRVDWFSFGCVVAEMISGVNPFRSDAALKFGLSHEESKEKAIDYATLKMEPQLCEKYINNNVHAKDLCLRLLDKDPNTRLGANGCEEIMMHPWFKTVQWEKIISDTYEPPFIPLKDINAATQSEIGTFAEDRNAAKLDETDDEIYKDWNWTNPRVFASEVLEMLIYERDTGQALVPLTAVGTCCCTIM